VTRAGPDLPEGLFVDGRLRAGTGGTFDVVDPATEEVIGRAHRATPDDLADALSSTRGAAPGWAALPAWSRAGVLSEVARAVHEQVDRLATVLTREQGKPLAESRGEVLASAEAFQWFAEEARRIYGRTIPGRTPDRQLMVLREPVGPVAAFTPSNFPWLLAARKIAAALAAGCAVVHKPAEETPFSALLMAELAAGAGLPPGVLNVVTGDPGQVATSLLGSEVIRMVSLTGSTRVGQSLLRQSAEGVKRVFMELGGHAPVVVLPGASLAEAARDLVAAKFRNAGQVCVSPSRAFVSVADHDEFVEAVRHETEQLVVGSGLEEGTDVGPLVSERRRTAVEALVRDARDQGARLVTGGHRCADRPMGYYYAPTVLTEVTPAMAVMRDEPFGPLLPIRAYDDVEHAVAEANSLDVGLAGYVVGADVHEAVRVARRLEVGMVGINGYGLAAAEAPFGGIKRSGFGVEAGAEGIAEYLTIRYLNLPA
jgi:succinate-semialdehyde dehydrogenase/glutarate-semialdehyde dehydrogenase